MAGVVAPLAMARQRQGGSRTVDQARASRTLGLPVELAVSTDAVGGSSMDVDAGAADAPSVLCAPVGATVSDATDLRVDVSPPTAAAAVQLEELHSRIEHELRLPSYSTRALLAPPQAAGLPSRSTCALRVRPQAAWLSNYSTRALPHRRRRRHGY